jgi:wyosine [tRNA(Phe)-imidazoG37] synthetase (radical SAM superfamily)
MNSIPIVKSNMVMYPIKQLRGKVCLSPYVSIQVGTTGDVSLCGCSSWMPSTVGNLFEQSIHDILSNADSVAIRQSMSQGTFEYCNQDQCGILQQNALNEIESLEPRLQRLVSDSSLYEIPHEIFLAGDATCNLSCPSCRKNIIKNSEQKHENNVALGKRLYDNIFSTPTDKTIRLHVSTSGEIFASPILLSFVNSISPTDFPGLELCIQTNGLLMEKHWHKLGAMQDRVSKITITTDAAQKSTYEKLRRGGKWDDIQQALMWISKKKQQTNMSLHLRMVAQYDNYLEMADFYQQSDALGTDVIEYSKIDNRGTYTSSEFAQHDVFSPLHPEYKHAQDKLDSIKHLPKVFLSGGLS